MVFPLMGPRTCSIYRCKPCSATQHSALFRTAPSHNIRHFCVRELGAMSKVNPAPSIGVSKRQGSILRWLICSLLHGPFLPHLTAKMAILRPVRGRGDSCHSEANQFRAWNWPSYPVSIGLFSICTSASDFAHLEQVTARFAVILASLAAARASLSWLGTSLPLPERRKGVRCYGPNCCRIFGRIETVEI
jgi:hypothetical protein